MAKAYASVNCENCGNPIGGQCPGVCPDCRKMMRQQEHRRKFSFQEFRKPFKLVSSPGNDDLKGMCLSWLDLRVGEYDWLSGAIFEKQGKEYVFDGKRVRVRE